MSDPRILHSAEDVTDDVLTDAENVFDGWYADARRIDWDEFIDRLVAMQSYRPDGSYDIEEMSSPAVRKIQRHVRSLRDA